MVTRRYMYINKLLQSSDKNNTYMLFLPLKHQVHIFELTCYVSIIIIDILMTAFFKIF